MPFKRYIRSDGSDSATFYQSSNLTDMDLEYPGGGSFNANVKAFVWVVGHQLKGSRPPQTTALEQIRQYVLLFVIFPPAHDTLILYCELEI
jgi:hypothetical protein